MVSTSKEELAGHSTESRGSFAQSAGDLFAFYDHLTLVLSPERRGDAIIDIYL